MTDVALSDAVEANAAELGIAGAAVGVWSEGQEVIACHGVTSLENPLPVDRDTLFLLGSITKTYTATALMRLVTDGRVELEAPVRRYVPELRLADDRAAAEITVLNLLNHTAGLDWGIIDDFGEGDGALAGYVDRMSGLRVIAQPGARASYSQAGYNLAGRVIEKVTSMTYERVLASLIFEPLGLSHNFFARDDIMTRRFAVGHNRLDDGTMSIARLWRRSRGDNPGGGIAGSVADQLSWVRFHLGDGRSRSGARLLPTNVLHEMKEPTTELRGSALGDAIGVGWFLRKVDGALTVGHSGSANGQFAEVLTVPDRGFGVVSLCNSGPNGIPFNRAVVRWALTTYARLVDKDPEPVPHDEAQAREVAGRYENDAQALVIATDDEGLTLEVDIKAEIRAAADKELPPGYPPTAIGRVPGKDDEYILTAGAMKGQRGFFTRDDRGEIVAVDLAGRLFQRVRSGGSARRPE